MINDRRITAEEVIKNMAYLNQLTLEVTNSCNLACEYCAYRDLYVNDVPKKCLYMTLDKIRPLFEYLSELWSKEGPVEHLTYISFYGGEPLLNMPFIKDSVDYFNNIKNIRRFRYSLTTNAVYLDRNIEFLVQNDFHILVSMDGDYTGHSYRKMKSGENSFETVYKNLKMVQSRYPSYFKNNVSFNAVIHDRNDDSKIIEFFDKEFGKVPRLSEMSTVGVRDDMATRFSKMHRRVMIDNLLDKKDVTDRVSLILNDSRVKDALLYLHKCSGNVFDSCSDLLKNRKECHVTPTGTCSPFSKKMFITVDGMILPCEKISHDFTVGEVSVSGLSLDPVEISSRTNRLFDKVQAQCSLCARKETCRQCMYNIKSIRDSKTVCGSFMNQDNYSQYQAEMLSVMKLHPDIYQLLMTTATFK